MKLEISPHRKRVSSFNSSVTALCVNKIEKKNPSSRLFSFSLGLHLSRTWQGHSKKVKNLLTFLLVFALSEKCKAWQWVKVV